MKAKMLLMVGLMLVGSYASASTVFTGNGGSWTSKMTGASFKGAIDGGFAGFLKKEIGGEAAKKFKRTSLTFDDFGVNDSRFDSGNLAIILGMKPQSDVHVNAFHLNLKDKFWKRHYDDDLTAVPLPAAAWLFGSALMGLTVVARRRDKKTPLVA